MKNLAKSALVVLSIFALAACGAAKANDKGYKLWTGGLPSGSKVDYCYYVKVTEESTTYYDAFAYIYQPTTGGFLPGYTNFKYEDGAEKIVKIEKSVYKEKYDAVKNGQLKGNYGKIVDNRS